MEERLLGSWNLFLLKEMFWFWIVGVVGGSDNLFVWILVMVNGVLEIFWSILGCSVGLYLRMGSVIVSDYGWYGFSFFIGLKVLDWVL